MRRTPQITKLLCNIHSLSQCDFMHCTCKNFPCSLTLMEIIINASSFQGNFSKQILRTTHFLYNNTTISKYFFFFKVTYGVRKAQINFLRLLSVEVRQVISIDCVNYPVIGYEKNEAEIILVEFIGWNYKIFGCNNIQMIKILKDTCKQVFLMRYFLHIHQ